MMVKYRGCISLFLLPSVWRDNRGVKCSHAGVLAWKHHKTQTHYTHSCSLHACVFDLEFWSFFSASSAANCQHKICTKYHLALLLHDTVWDRNVLSFLHAVRGHEARHYGIIWYPVMLCLFYFYFYFFLSCRFTSGPPMGEGAF